MALPVNGSTHLIPALLLIYRPRKNERLSWPSWLTCRGWFTHISGHPSAAGRARDRESSPVRDWRSTTVLCHQPATTAAVCMSNTCVPANIVSRKWRVLKATPQMTTQGGICSLCCLVWHEASLHLHISPSHKNFWCILSMPESQG